MYVIDPTNPSSTLDDRVKHRLYVRRRAADNAKHLGGRRLMFQSFPQFCIALLDLLEQSDILDGDDRLVGEGLQKRNLFLRKRTHLRPANMDRPDRNSLAQEWWGCQSCADAARRS